MKMHITENKAERKFIIEKHFPMKCFPDFPDTHSKFPDNTLFFGQKGSIFRFPDNPDCPNFQVTKNYQKYSKLE